MSELYYSVVEFEDGSVDAVPSNWLNKEKSMCAWPGAARAGKLRKSAGKADEGWEKFVCVELKSCRSLSDAIAAAKKAVYSDNLEVTPISRNDNVGPFLRSTHSRKPVAVQQNYADLCHSGTESEESASSIASNYSSQEAPVITRRRRRRNRSGSIIADRQIEVEKAQMQGLEGPDTLVIDKSAPMRLMGTRKRSSSDTNVAANFSEHLTGYNKNKGGTNKLFPNTVPKPAKKKPKFVDSTPTASDTDDSVSTTGSEDSTKKHRVTDNQTEDIATEERKGVQKKVGPSSDALYNGKIPPTDVELKEHLSSVVDRRIKNRATNKQYQKLLPLRSIKPAHKHENKEAEKFSSTCSESELPECSSKSSHNFKETSAASYQHIPSESKGNDHNKIALLHPNTPNVSVEGLIAADKLGEQKYTDTSTGAKSISKFNKNSKLESAGSSSNKNYCSGNLLSAHRGFLNLSEKNRKYMESDVNCPPAGELEYFTKPDHSSKGDHISAGQNIQQPAKQTELTVDVPVTPGAFNNLLVQQKQFRKEVTQKLAYIISKIHEVNVQRVAKYNNYYEDAKHEFRMFTIPFNEEEKLIEFMEWAKESHNWQKAVLYLGSIGGSDVRSTVDHILTILLTNKLALSFLEAENHFRDTPEIASRLPTRLVDLLLSAVKLQNLTANCSYFEIKGSISNYLSELKCESHTNNNQPKAQLPVNPDGFASSADKAVVE